MSNKSRHRLEVGDEPSTHSGSGESAGLQRLDAAHDESSVPARDGRPAPVLRDVHGSDGPARRKAAPLDAPIPRHDEPHGSLFSLANLKRDASRGGKAIDGGAAFTPVRDDVLLALVEAVERARYLAIPWVVDAADSGDQIAEGDLRRLRKAFDAFAFDGTTDE